MTPTELREAGEALYGSRFASQLARDLGVAVRTVQRWLAGKHVIPDNLTSNISELVTKRAAALDRLGKRLAVNNDT